MGNSGKMMSALGKFKKCVTNLSDKILLEKYKDLRDALDDAYKDANARSLKKRMESSLQKISAQKARDKEIGDWVKNNIKEGDVVKVLGSSNMSFRIVQNLTDKGFEGRHCSVTKDGKIKKKGGYITHHLNKKVIAIVQDG